MSEDRIVDLITHMREAATDACAFVDGIEKQQFQSDKRTQQAVVYSILIVGEAATKLMDQHIEFIINNEQIPWRKMRGMRNRIAHGYFEIDLGIVWDTVHEALPALISQLESLDLPGDG